METVKLQKYFSDCAIMSRRAAEEEIKKGKVTVNGAIATLGDRIDPARDEVIYKGKRVLPPKKNKTYVLLNKPRGIVTTLSDEKGRPTVISLLRGLGARVYPVGRLDIDSDGLLLLTDDGELTNRLTHPRHQIPKIYHVTVKGAVSPEQLSALSSEMTLDGYKILPVKTSIVSKSATTTVLEMTLFEGRNRQIRKMCDTQSLKITRLCRIAIGHLSLGNLPQGRWRQLSKSEVEYLRGGNDKKKGNTNA